MKIVIYIPFVFITLFSLTLASISQATPQKVLNVKNGKAAISYTSTNSIELNDEIEFLDANQTTTTGEGIVTKVLKNNIAVVKIKSGEIQKNYFWQKKKSEIDDTKKHFMYLGIGSGATHYPDSLNYTNTKGHLKFSFGVGYYWSLLSENSFFGLAMENVSDSFEIESIGYVNITESLLGISYRYYTLNKKLFLRADIGYAALFFSTSKGTKDLRNYNRSGGIGSVLGVGYNFYKKENKTLSLDLNYTCRKISSENFCATLLGVSYTQ